jgi:hypothetical protein
MDFERELIDPCFGQDPLYNIGCRFRWRAFIQFGYSRSGRTGVMVHDLVKAASIEGNVKMSFSMCPDLYAANIPASFQSRRMVNVVINT